MPAPLTIYRASAGAGKTFRLVVEYIKLLMLRPDEYKHILAVTFTKKATQEMKTRILSQLYGLREGLKSSNSYLKCITKEMNLPAQDVRRNAGKALEMILGDYNYFQITTIDSFFQRVLRNMTRELDISANMRVELNGPQVKDKAVDAMISDLKPSDHIFRRIEEFTEENMAEGKTWNIVNDLKEFGANIFSDFYQSHSKDYKQRIADNPLLFKEYKSKLYAIKQTAYDGIIKAAGQLHDVFNAHGVDVSIFSDSNRSGLGKLFQYISNGTVTSIPAKVAKYAESEDAWLTKANQKKYGHLPIASVFLPALRNFLCIQERFAKELSTCSVLLKTLNNLELLGEIEDAVDSSNQNANRFLLSSTNQLLSEMIADADSPFIYEKIGTQIHHLMIDEFQDTSTLQWKNFKHLLKESMSYYDAEKARGTVGNMIVGDVKQSIYRWRDGDWQLLNGIVSEFKDGDVEEEPLSVNYRSEPNIIHFNNAFFLACKDFLDVSTAYDNVGQKVNGENEVDVQPTLLPGRGLIEFTMLSKEAYKTRQHLICQKVDELIKSGVEQKNIAILARKTYILRELSKTFMDEYPDIQVVSKESFQFSASKAVSTIVCALKYLLNPNDRILLAVIEKHSGLDEKECARRLESISKAKPLTDIVQEIAQALNIEKIKEDNAFVSAFFDHLKDFTSKNTSTIRNFLKYWEETVSEKAIETESTNGVQLLTIHKSKGLEFDNVIIADGNWDMKVSRNHIWVEIDDEPFDDIPFSIVRAAKALTPTIFGKAYENEIQQNTIDNLNLLYVAFTRAGQNLYFFGETKKKPNEIEAQLPPEKNNYGSAGASSTVEKCLDSLKLACDYSFDTSNDNLFFYKKTFGSFAAPKPPEEKDRGNVFNMPVEPQDIPVHHNKQEVHFIQSNRSKAFISSDSFEDIEKVEKVEEIKEIEKVERSKHSESYMSIGRLLHYVLSQIATLDDVDTVLSRLEMEGVIGEKRLSNLIRKRISDSRYAKEWFAPGWTVYNECQILASGENKRPDRVITNGKETVVIDFKFGTPKPDHRTQVLEYKQLLEEIGLPNVKACLWYVYKDEVEAVEAIENVESIV